METHSSSQRFGLSPRSVQTVSPLARRSESDTSGNPFIAPHRIAKVMRDERAYSDFTDVDAETAKAAEELIGRIFRLVCVIGFTTLAVCVLFYLSTGYIRGVFQ